MSARLTAFIDGQRVGAFVRTRNDVAFTFDDDWRRSARRLELTLSMPKSRRVHTGAAPVNYLWNLLPDNDGHHGPTPYWRVIGANGGMGGIVR